MIEVDLIPKQIASLERMTVGQLQKRYAEVFGEPARSGNKQWLFRRVSWRIQALAEGDLAKRAIERSRALARDLARDADLRLRPPPAPPPTLRGSLVATTQLAIDRDERVPPAGTVITRRFKGREYSVAILPNGFEFEGETFRSLSAVAHAITGSHWNGMLFFGLTKPKEAARS